MWCTRQFRSIWSSFKEISRNKVPILFNDTRLLQFFMTSDFLKRVSVSHWHGYKCMIFEIQLCDCKVNQASWSAGHLEGSMNVNLTCKISKKFHIPKQTPSTGGSSRQSHSRCSVHIDMSRYIYIYILSSSLQSSLSKLFVAGSDLACACDTPSLASWSHLPPEPWSVAFNILDDDQNYTTQLNKKGGT